MTATDTVFAGSIPGLYDRHLGPQALRLSRQSANVRMGGQRDDGIGRFGTGISMGD